MADIQSQNPIGTEHKETQSNEKVDQQLFDGILCELEVTEEKIFNGDGKLGVESNDTIMDKEYNEAMKDATDIKTKLKIIQKLMLSFRYKYLDINEVTEGHKNSKYLDTKGKESIDIFRKEYHKLLEKNPAYTGTISTYFNLDLDFMNSRIRFYEDKFQRTQNPKDLEPIKDYLNNYKVYLTTDIPILEKNIEGLSKIPQIKNKDACLQYIIRNDFYWLFEMDGDLGPEIEKLFSIDFIAQGFSDDEKDDNNEKTFKYGTLSVLMDIGMENVNKINKLYKDPNKKEELVKLLESFPPNQKNRLLEIKVFKDIKSLEIKSKIISQDMDFSKLDFEDQNIKDIFLSVSKISQNIDLTDFYKGISKMLNNGNPKDFNKFLSQGGEFDGLMQLCQTPADKFYLCQIFESIALYISGERLHGDESFNFYMTTNALLSDKKEAILNEIKTEIHKKRATLEPEKLVIFDKDLKEIIGKNIITDKIIDDLNFKDILKIKATKNYEKTSNHKGDIGLLLEIAGSTKNLFVGPQSKPQELKIEKQQQTTSESKRQEMQARLSGLGVGENELKIDEKTGKLVNAVDPGKPFEKDIGHGKQIKLTVDGELILLGSLGYNMKYENNSTGMEKALETAETFDYMNKIGLGFFGNNLKPMLATMDKYLPSQTGYLNIDENKGDFLSMKELNEIVIPIFKNVGFIDKNQNLDYLFPEEITDTTMAQRVSLLPHGTSFAKGKPFDERVYKNVLQSTNKV